MYLKIDNYIYKMCIYIVTIFISFKNKLHDKCAFMGSLGLDINFCDFS